MKLILDDSEITELLIQDIVKTEDKGLVIIKGEFQGLRREGREDVVKEIIALDAIELGPTRAAAIHNTTTSSASKYSDGKDIADDDTRARVLSQRHSIADTAISKLMDTLNLFDPSDMDKPRDIIDAAAKLSSIVEKITPASKEGGNQVHLHLYGPKQKTLESYEVIDV